MGKVTDSGRQPGGDLYVYNSTITADIPDAEHIFDCATRYRDLAVCLHPGEVRFVNASLSWFGGWYGLHAGNSVLVNSVFSHGDCVVGNAVQKATNCTFRHIGVVLREAGCMAAELVRCTFTDNGHNWTLGSISSGDIILVDCNVAPQKEPLRIRKNRMPPQQAARLGRPLYPSCIERESLLVRVLDADGQPVPRALVRVRCPADPGAVGPALALTDQQGMTPGTPEEHAILVTTRRTQATDEPDKPITFTYDYTVDVRTRAGARIRVPLSSANPIPRPLVVPLEQNGK